MEQKEKKSISDLFQNKSFLYSLPIFLIAIAGILWYLVDEEATSKPITPSALNTNVPSANTDSTGQGKLHLQDQQKNQDDAEQQHLPVGSFQSNVPGSLDRYVYRSPKSSTENQTMSYMDTTIYGGNPRSTGGLPTRLKPTIGTAPSFKDAPMSEKDFQLSNGYGYDPKSAQDLNPESQLQKKTDLEKALKDRQKLITLLEDYKKDKLQQALNEGDKRKVKKVVTPDVVGSLDESLKGAGNGFYGLMSEDAKRIQKQQLEAEVGTIRAMIYGDQDVVSSGRVKMRLLEPVSVRGITIPANTLVYGTGSFTAERVNVKISAIQFENHILPVSMTAYDMDGMVGVYVPNIMGLTEAKQAVGQSVNGVNLNTYGGVGSVNAAAMVGTSAANAALQGAKQVLQRKTAIQKAHLKSNYYVLLRSNEPGSGTGN